MTPYRYRARPQVACAIIHHRLRQAHSPTRWHGRSSHQRGISSEYIPRSEQATAKQQALAKHRNLLPTVPTKQPTAEAEVRARRLRHRPCAPPPINSSPAVQHMLGRHPASQQDSAHAAYITTQAAPSRSTARARTRNARLRSHFLLSKSTCHPPSAHGSRTPPPICSLLSKPGGPKMAKGCGRRAACTGPSESAMLGGFRGRGGSKMGVRCEGVQRRRQGLL